MNKCIVRVLISLYHHVHHFYITLWRHSILRSLVLYIYQIYCPRLVQSVGQTTLHNPPPLHQYRSNKEVRHLDCLGLSPVRCLWGRNRRRLLHWLFGGWHGSGFLRWGLGRFLNHRLRGWGRGLRLGRVVCRRDVLVTLCGGGFVDQGSVFRGRHVACVWKAKGTNQVPSKREYNKPLNC